jgi:prephenate dehydrogenase
MSFAAESGPYAAARVAIIGSAGRYGRWLAGFFKANPVLAVDVRGHDPADPSSDAPDALAPWADVVVFCAPVAKTVAVIERFARCAPSRAHQQLWMDLTSIKAAPVAAMQASGAEVLGLHPMCAPPKHPHLDGHRLVVCEQRLRTWRPWATAFLAATRAILVPIDAREHDRRAAQVQALGHAAHLAQLTVLARGDLTLDALDACATPTFSLDLAMGMRLLSGDPALYAGLLSLTNESRASLVALRDACNVLVGATDSDSPLEALVAHIEALQRWAGPQRIRHGEAGYRRAIEGLASPTD